MISSRCSHPTYPGLTTLLSCQANKNRSKIQAGPVFIRPDTRSRRGIKNTSAVKILSDPKVKISQTSQKVLIPLADQPFEKILEKNLLRLTPPPGGLKYACRARAGRTEPLIQPLKTTTLDLCDMLRFYHPEEVVFVYYGEYDKFMILESGRTVLEFWPRNFQIYYRPPHSAIPFEDISGSMVFLDRLLPKYPEIVDWFMFNTHCWNRKRND